MRVTRQDLIDLCDKFLNEKIDKTIIQDFALSAISDDDLEWDDDVIADTIFEWDNEEINFEIKGNPIETLIKISNYYRKKENDVSLIDGVSISGNDFYLNIRPSLSEPYLRLNIESTSQKMVNELVQEVTSIINNI